MIFPQPVSLEDLFLNETNQSQKHKYAFILPFRRGAWTRLIHKVEWRHLGAGGLPQREQKKMFQTFAKLEVMSQECVMKKQRVVCAGKQEEMGKLKTGVLLDNPGQRPRASQSRWQVGS